MKFLADPNLIYNKENAWVIGVCIGIIIVCSILIIIKVAKLAHYNNELERSMRRREKLNSFKRKNKF